jgi:hypothetical protein
VRVQPSGVRDGNLTGFVVEMVQTSFEVGIAHVGVNFTTCILDLLRSSLCADRQHFDATRIICGELLQRLLRSLDFLAGRHRDSSCLG